MNKLHLLPAAVGFAAMLAACASIGHPDGGPRDTEPPRYVSSNPMPGSLNVTTKKITVIFDENVQLDDPGSKVAISPTQKTNPRISANGHRVEIELEDTLLPDMSYTIDLADAVKDLNEGNPMDGFAIDFSTGPSIDTLQISGMVLEAQTLEPAQGMLVGVYKSEADSCITTERFHRIARTNQFGQFTVRNLSPGNYQLFALNDLNRDYHWDRTEDVGFYSGMIAPTVEMTLTAPTDTLMTDSVRQIHYLPDNVLLTWFNEDYKPQYLKDYKRVDRNRIQLEMNAPSDSLPRLNIVTLGAQANLRIPIEEVSLLVRNADADTLNYWLTDSAIIAADTMLIETRYRRVDSVENIVWHTDTLKFNIRNQRGKKSAKKQTLQEKIDSILAISDTIKIDTFALMQPTTWLDLSLRETTQDLNKGTTLMATRPIKSIDFSGFSLEMMQDSVWIPVETQPEINFSDTLSHSRLGFQNDWLPGTNYRLVVDSMVVFDLYGNYNRPLKMEFKTRNVDDYSTILFNIAGLPDTVPAVIELLNNEDKPVMSKTIAGGTVMLDYLLPATYYARLYLDSDTSGTWTNGKLRERLQPEEVYYFPKKLTIKKNWDRNEFWDINALSADMQKPQEIKKNKPKPKPGEARQQSSDSENEEDEEEDGDGFGTNHFSPTK